ncbi:MAG TPA: GGDEF domain-containing protein [Candidatus Woesearchaeota archaeon]|nr:MAG: hypothetical protein DRJ25_03720 [Candidatus Woesearchaeota archaeon]HDD70773.1 GGDEF domain-containing protein [Candidatus Woesearchaeota archaeon]
MIMEAKKRRTNKEDEEQKQRLSERIQRLGKTIQFPGKTPNEAVENLDYNSQRFSDLSPYWKIFSQLDFEAKKDLLNLTHHVLDIFESYEEKIAQEQKLREQAEKERQSLADKIFEISQENTILKKNNTKLLQKAQLDHLTRVYNKQVFEDQLSTLIKTAKEQKDTLSLIIFDLDGFKPINDTYGHQAGDDVLKKLSEEITTYFKDNLRESDIFARLGGDEFAIILYKTNEEGAYHVAERIKTIIDETSISYKGKTLNVGVTIGVKQYSSEESLEEFVGKTDAALYVGKDSGKGKIIRYKEFQEDIEKRYIQELNKNTRQ